MAKRAVNPPHELPRHAPWDGPELTLIEESPDRDYTGNAVFGARWDAPIADDAPVYSTPVGMACYDCAEPIADGDRGMLRGGVWSDPDRPGGYITQVRPVHFECDTLGMIGCLWGICHCRQPRDACSGQVGINIDDMPRRTAALLLLERMNAARARQGQRPM